MLLKNKPTNKPSNDPSTTNVIVLQNKDGLYGVYNEDGKQIVDFKYKKIGKFLDNTAEVRNDKDEVGIINSNGKMIVDFGKYKYISRIGYLFRVSDKDYKSYLLDSEGKLIYDLEKKNAEDFMFPKELVVVETEKEYDVLDYKGKSLIKLPKVDDKEYKVYENEDNYATLYYNNVSYIIDIYDRKIVKKLGSETPYCVKSVNKVNKDEYVVSSCDATEKAFKYMNGDKEVFESNTCTNMFFEYDVLLCADNYKRYIVDEKGNNGIEYYRSNIVFIDGLNYLERDQNNTQFYVNGKEDKNIECKRPYIVASREDEVYLLKNSCSTDKDKLSYYDKNGKILFDKLFKTASAYDENKLARVSEDGEGYYLIDIKGKKISETYDYIDHESTRRDCRVYKARKDSKNILLDKNGKEIITTDGTIIVYDNYYTVQKDSKITYYTFTGKEFYKA